ASRAGLPAPKASARSLIDLIEDGFVRCQADAGSAQGPYRIRRGGRVTRVTPLPASEADAAINVEDPWRGAGSSLGSSGDSRKIWSEMTCGFLLRHGSRSCGSVARG